MVSFRRLAAAMVSALAVAGCAGSADLPITEDGAVISGRARLDGGDLTAEWMGARVRSGGMVTPCQQSLPPIEEGEYAISVFGAGDSAGCGKPGAEILLWTHTGEEMLHATSAIPWPSTGTATVDVDFATSDPLGAALATTDFSGEVYLSDGQRVPLGSLVEAYVDDTLCGVASIRSSDGFTGYILSVVGPNSKPGCREGGAITFRVDGAPAVETAVNSPDQSTHLELTVGTR